MYRMKDVPEFIRKTLMKIKIDGLKSSLSTNKMYLSDLK